MTSKEERWIALAKSKLARIERQRLEAAVRKIEAEIRKTLPADFPPFKIRVLPPSDTR